MNTESGVMDGDSVAAGRARLRSAAVSPTQAAAWLPGVAGAMAYPLALHVFFLSAESARAETGAMQGLTMVCTSALLLVVLAVPCAALQNLLTLRKSTAPDAPQLRRLLHLAFATPPLYLLLTYITYPLSESLGVSDRLVTWWGWWVVWIVLAAAAWLFRSQGSPTFTVTPAKPRSSSFPWAQVRRVHRYAALGVLLSFLALHLGNHLAAFWSLPAQQAVMQALRPWYRGDFVQPVILTAFAIMSAAGLTLVIRHTRAPSDTFRVLQTASGVYLAFFIAKHCAAIFLRRAAGHETDWAYASGSAYGGMLGTEDYSDVFPYYVLGVFLVGVHAAMGLRMVMLARGKDKSAATRAAYMVIGLGGAVTILITAALLGVRLA